MIRKAGFNENGEQLYKLTDLGVQAAEDMNKPFYPLRKFMRKIFNVSKPWDNNPSAYCLPWLLK